MRIIKTLLRTRFTHIPIEIKESFQTVKKRLLDNQEFLEATHLGGGKVIYNKATIASITRTETIGKKKKKEK